VQLGRYLEDGGAEKLNVIAIAWTEGRYGDASPARLRSFIRSFHPSIRIVHADARVEKDFSPLVYVPANFVFDGQGRVRFGDGNRMHLDQRQIAFIVDKVK
jgi:hypothetical protein|tara:strand:- start:92 stop:394 length:303 start_codon:yes stop_codon:yes gene_type:complete